MIISQVGQVTIFSFSYSSLVQVILVCVLYPYFTVGFVVIAILFVLLDMTMNKGVLESKKLDNLMKSPVIHHISSCMSGVNIIRGFGKEDVFKRRFVHLEFSLQSLFSPLQVQQLSQCQHVCRQPLQTCHQMVHVENGFPWSANNNSCCCCCYCYEGWFIKIQLTTSWTDFQIINFRTLSPQQ